MKNIGTGTVFEVLQDDNEETKLKKKNNYYQI